MQSFPGRGAAVAPEPSREPSATSARAREAAPAGDEQAAAAGDEQAAAADEFFTALGPAWPLSAGQRARLAPLVEAAVAAGWDPVALAELVGANTAGIRSPYAVLAARLAPGELPAAPARPARQPRRGRPDEDGAQYAALLAARVSAGPGPAGRDAICQARAVLGQARTRPGARADP